MSNPLLDALGWAGESLDKPGAAVRGLLAGRPDQLANLIPFSDTLGITDPSQRVSGRGLLEHYGALAPKQEGEGFGLGDLAGMAVSAATDPLTWLGGMGARKLLGALAPGQEASAAARVAQEANVASRGLPTAETGLTHFTPQAGLEGMAESGTIRGRGGIFALPDAARNESPLARAVRAGISPESATNPISVPAEALGQFEKPLPIGPYSLWKRLGGVQYAAPGEIDLATGALTPSGSIWTPRMALAAPDLAMYGAGGGAAYLKNKLQGDYYQ